MVGFPRNAAVVLLPLAIVADGLRQVVHGKGTTRHAVGHRVPDHSADGEDFHRANRRLADFCHVGADSRAFFPLRGGTTCARTLAVDNGSPPLPLFVLLQPRCLGSLTASYCVGSGGMVASPT